MYDDNSIYNNSVYYNSPKVRRCAQLVLNGGVIAYPTEAVWGLGCHPFNAAAVSHILSLKQRHWRKGLILVAADISQFDFLLTEINDADYQKLQDSWPGHVTWLVEHHGRIPKYISGEHDTIAVRVSAHPLVRALCQRIGGPLVSTSANPQGMPPATNGVAARRYFKHQGVAFSPGVVGREQKPSRIMDLRSGRQIR